MGGSAFWSPIPSDDQQVDAGQHRKQPTQLDHCIILEPGHSVGIENPSIQPVLSELAGQGGEPAGEETAANGGADTDAADGSSPPSRHHASGDCSSGESNTRAKRSASCATHFKAGSGGGDASGSGSGSREGSGQEDGPSSAQQSAQQLPRAPAAQNPGARNSKHKLARPEGKVPCPRCNSEDTKFCYYNNYNIKQPRYFCKSCQRYWTAGGILRNVPVGAGRRKSKSSAVREQEKANAAAAAKQAVQARHVGPNTAGLLPNGMPPPLHAMPGPHTDPSASDLLQLPGTANTAYAEQLRYMMDPSAQLAAAMGNPALGSGAVLGAPLGGIPGAGSGYDPSMGLLPPGGGMAAMNGGAGGMPMSAAIGTPRLGDTTGTVLASGGMGGPLAGFNPSAMVPGDALHAPTSGMQQLEDGCGADGRRVRAKLDHSGLAGDLLTANAAGTSSASGSGNVATGSAEGTAGGEERHAEWQQQAAAMQAAQFSALQQAAALQAQAQLQAAAVGWGQAAPNPYGMPGAGLYPWAAGAYGMGSPNWAAAAQLNASRFGNLGGTVVSEADGGDSSKTAVGAAGSGMVPTGGDISGDLSLTGMGSGGISGSGSLGMATSMGMAGLMPAGSMGANGMAVGGMGAWSGMMPTGSQAGMVGSWPPAPQWAPNVDLSMPHNKHMGGTISGAGGGSSMGSGNSTATGLNAPGV